MDPFVDALTQALEEDMSEWLIGVMGVGVLALVFSFWLQVRVSRMDPGNAKMQKIAGAIQKGAMAFLKTEYTILAAFAAVMAIVLFVFLDKDATPDVNEGMITAICFLVGCLCSGLAGFLGMRTATTANVRTTQAANSTGLGAALRAAFSSGAVMGFSESAAGTVIIGVKPEHKPQ